MGILLVVALLLALLFLGLGFVVHTLFWVAVLCFLVWVIALCVNGTRRSSSRRRM